MDLLSTFLKVSDRMIMMKIIPSIKLPIIKNGDSSNHILSEITKNKIIINTYSIYTHSPIIRHSFFSRKSFSFIIIVFNKSISI